MGACVDIPNVPEGDTYKHKVRIKSYPIIEKAGLIWVYMGPEDKQPPFYQFEWLETPANHRFMQKPTIRFAILESGFGWLPFWAMRMQDQVDYMGYVPELRHTMLVQWRVESFHLIEDRKAHVHRLQLCAWSGPSMPV